MTTLVRIQETERQALTRLLAKAKAEGVTIMCDRTDGRYYATSASKPGTLHYVTAYSCTCRGFMAHQRCKHHASLLAALGWLDVDPEPPTPGMALTVVHVEGHYERGGWLVTNDCPEWQPPVTTITISDNNAIRIVGDGFDTEVRWLECGRVVDDMTAASTVHNHFDAVVHWLRSIDANAPIHTLLQNAGLFHANEFVDDCPLGLEAA